MKREKYRRSSWAGSPGPPSSSAISHLPERFSVAMSSVFWFTFSDMERRLTATLAAAVVGYSRLMGANESGTLATLDALRADFVNPKISEHQGRIVKLTGDGMLVEFPSVVNAVACAAELQRRMRERNVDGAEDRRSELRLGG